MVSVIYAIVARDIKTKEEQITAYWDAEAQICMPGASEDKRVAMVALEQLKKLQPPNLELKIIQFARMDA